MATREWHYHHRSFAGGAGYRICLRLYRAARHAAVSASPVAHANAVSPAHTDRGQELDAAARAARAMGLPTLVLSGGLAGDTTEAARGFANVAAQVRRRGQPLHPPCCLLAGDETTVVRRSNAGDDRSERSAEFALAAALVLDGAEEIVVASLATGGDERTQTVGAVATTYTLAHARAMGLDAADYLRRNDARAFFAHVGGLVRLHSTDTDTNANALMIALIA